MGVQISNEAAEEFRALMQDPASREAFVALKREAADSSHARYIHVLDAMLASPWAIFPPYMAILADLVVDRIAGVRLSAEEISERISAARRSAPQGPRGVAVIPIHGPIVPRATVFSDVSGATSIEGIRSGLREALSANEIDHIVFAIDSPGGSAQGVPELAGEIRAARGRKPMTAIADGMMASAAYWLGSQADEVVASKSSLLGSIGVITAHTDLTKAAEMAGIKQTLISAGKFKTLGDPMEPLTGEGLARIQGLVDEFYGMFTSDVARARKVNVEDVRSGFAQGGVVLAKQAVAEGMADRVGTLEEVLVAAPPRALAAIIDEELPATSAAATNLLITFTPSEDTSTTLVESPALAGDPAITAGGSGAATDESEWDEGAVMGGDHDAAYYRGVSGIEHNAGEPDQRQHWALPHHKAPGRPANARAIRNARSRFEQTQDLKNPQAARRHIFETHRLPSETAETSATPPEADVEHTVSPDARARMLRLARLKNDYLR